MVVFETKELRISVITDRLIRTEKGGFTDLPTQTVVDRDFCKVDFRLTREGKNIHIATDEARFTVDTKSGRVTRALTRDGRIITDFVRGRLPGTYRTLDTANGPVKLEKGITSRSGGALMDDSKSLIVHPDGSIGEREKCSDLYWFAYGSDYLGQLRDFFALTGRVPLIPKYALGNWWSRYKAYTQEEYKGLLQIFIDKNIPITVATIDMDWHWTDVISRFGKEAKSEKPKCIEELIYYYLLQGWTGYSWNTELFPDYRELLSWLNENGFYITLNVHPSQGVRFFEDQYTEMCNRLGRDPEKKEIIPFDFTDEEFRRAYFELLHHPYENDGVDFWWIDWQQGTKSNLKGLDPLWALNHYHTLDASRGNNRPLILSRYAGLGSHRYPLGFSGDTVCSWKSLDFQPYFTNSAANSGYTWWSHDIGGHMRGVQDDELYLRWLQYGVFSPINRLHSTNSEFMSKEPWKRSWAVSKISEEFLRLRHRLIPYLYTANYRTHTEGEPICMPMYYRYDCPEAYRVKNQYIFAGQLLVCPITRRMDNRLNLAYVDVWLPEGRWTDIFNGRIYEGGRMVRMYRDLDSIPVLAPAGAIIPMYRDDGSNSLSLARPLEIRIYRGNGSYELYEDDGVTKDYENGAYVNTQIKLEETASSLRLTITPPEDSHGLLPAERDVYIKFCDIIGEDILLKLANKPVTVEISNPIPTVNESKKELREAILTRVQGSNDWKNARFNKRPPRFVKDALSEIDMLKY